MRVAFQPRPLKVLTIAHNAVAASNRRRTDVLRNLADVEVSLLTPRWWFEEGRRIDVPRSAPWRVGRTAFSGNGTRYIYLTGLIKALRDEKPDVIDLFEEPFTFVALQTLLLRYLLAPRAALVFYSAVNVHRRWRRPYRWTERVMLKHADGAHVPSQDVVPVLRAKGFGIRKPVSVIPLGVDVEPFSYATPMALPGSPGRPRIGFVGRLEPVKGLDVLLDAFDHLTTRASLVITGDGSERVRLEARIASSPPHAERVILSEAKDPRPVTGQESRVHLLPPVNYADMPSFLKSLDILVLPSVTILPMHREQFGRVLVEAMAAGVAVIGSSSGAIPEVIGDAGLVVPERDPAALANAIDLLLTDEPRRQALVERGHQRVRARFAWPVVAEQTNDLFHAAVAHRRRAIAPMEAVNA